MNVHVTLLAILIIYQITHNKSICCWGGMKNQKIQICPVSNRATEIVFIHGHGQCSFCKANINPCCSVETADEKNKDDIKK